MIGDLRPNEQRGKIAIALIWIIIVVNLISLLFSLIVSISLMRTNDIGGFDSSSYYQGIYPLFRLFSFLYLLLLIVSIAVFIRWFRRAYYNLNIFTNECAYDDSWAAKAWIVPFLNLYRPYEMMKELYEKTDRYLFEQEMLLSNNELYTERLNIDKIKWWWRISIVLAIVYILQYFFPFWGVPFLSFGLSVFGLAKIGLLMTSGVLLVSIIKDYQKAEKTLAQTLENDKD